jgi:hypothetical protein
MKTENTNHGSRSECGTGDPRKFKKNGALWLRISGTWELRKIWNSAMYYGFGTTGIRQKFQQDEEFMVGISGTWEVKRNLELGHVLWLWDSWNPAKVATG